MNKVKLLGIAAEPYHIGTKWEGAVIHMPMEAGVHLLEIRLELRSDLLALSQLYGYKDIERLIMRRVENSLDSVQKSNNVTPKDINTIYEIVRLKMPRFIHKSALRVSYFWNAVTGDIRENEDK